MQVITDKFVCTRDISSSSSCTILCENLNSTLGLFYQIKDGCLKSFCQNYTLCLYENMSCCTWLNNLDNKLFNKSELSKNNSCFKFFCKFLGKLIQCNKATELGRSESSSNMTKEILSLSVFPSAVDSFPALNQSLNTSGEMRPSSIVNILILSSFSPMYTSAINLIPTPLLITEVFYQSSEFILSTNNLVRSDKMPIGLMQETIKPTNSFKQTSLNDSITNSADIDNLNIVASLSHENFFNNFSLSSNFKNQTCTSCGADKTDKLKDTTLLSSIAHSDMLMFLLKLPTATSVSLSQQKIVVSEFSPLPTAAMQFATIHLSALSTNTIQLSASSTTTMQLCMYPCFQSACLNNGTCLVDASNPLGFRCSCTNEFTGEFCDQVKDNCFDNPCNGGFCISIKNSFKCLCPFGKTGNQCLAGN